MRTRSTWIDPKNRQAAQNRTAEDIYDMNGEHPQPSPTEYENGNPDSWAESPSNYDNVAEEYDGDHVKRNEIGMGEFRKDTWDGAGQKPWGSSKKYDNRTAASQLKARDAMRIASSLLQTSDKDTLKKVASAFLTMPEGAVIATVEAMHLASPDSLSKDNKYKRTVACVKLAKHMLNDSDDEALVERLARTLVKIPDSILHPIVKTVASFLVSAKEEEEKEEDTSEGHQAQSKSEEDDMPSKQAQQTEEEPEGKQAQMEEEACLTAEEQCMLDEMCAEPGPQDDLTQVFQPAPAPTVVVETAPMMASEIQFGGSDDPKLAEVDHNKLATALFGDDPEVQGHRSTQAAAGFSRQASQGAKKLGNVQVDKTQKNATESLSDLWRLNKFSQKPYKDIKNFSRRTEGETKNPKNYGRIRTEMWTEFTELLEDSEFTLRFNRRSQNGHNWWTEQRRFYAKQQRFAYPLRFDSRYYRESSGRRIYSEQSKRRHDDGKQVNYPPS